jgi:N-acetylglutamate synthase
MKHIVEPMRIADFEEVYCLWQKSEGVGLSEADGRTSIELFLRRNPDCSQVARNQTGRIIGAALCGHDGRRGCLYHLAVDKEHRKRGVGKKLVESCLAHLQAAGIHRCNIFVYADNDAGKAFWKHEGWKERVELRLMQREIERQPSGEP